MSTGLTINYNDGATLSISNNNEVSLSITTQRLPYKNFLSLQLSSVGDITEGVPVGFSGDLSYSYSDNCITITSSVEDFSNLFVVLGNAIRAYKFNGTTAKIWLAPNWSTDYDQLVFEIYRR